MPHGFNTRWRRDDIHRLVDVLEQVAGPMLVVGDFNMTEYSPDYHLIRARLVDAYRAVGWGFGHTYPSFLSFPKPLPAPWPVVRLDYVWLSRQLEPISARLGRSDGSDHHPVIVRFARRAFVS